MVFSSETSEAFQKNLEKACSKIDQKSVCECYSRTVTERYSDQQLASISVLLKDKKAQQMFLVVHSKEGIECGSQGEQR